jgi:hypothetical protein
VIDQRVIPEPRKHFVVPGVLTERQYRKILSVIPIREAHGVRDHPTHRLDPALRPLQTRRVFFQRGDECQPAPLAFNDGTPLRINGLDLFEIPIHSAKRWKRRD